MPSTIWEHHKLMASDSPDLSEINSNPEKIRGLTQRFRYKARVMEMDKSYTTVPGMYNASNLPVWNDLIIL